MDVTLAPEAQPVIRRLRFGAFLPDELPSRLAQAVGSVPDGSSVMVDLCGRRQVTGDAARALIAALREAARRNVDAVIVADDASVREPLVVNGVDRIVPLSSSIPDAARVLRRLALR